MRRRLERLVLDVLLDRLCPDGYGRDPVSDLDAMLDRAAQRLVVADQLDRLPHTDEQRLIHRRCAIALAVPMFALLPQNEYEAVVKRVFRNI